MKSYLDQALRAYSESDYYPFHMPGHKRQYLGSEYPETIDITEIEGFDNLHHAQGMIKDAQERLAQVFGAQHSFFLVNGSTGGLLAAICASAKKGARILMGRNCHKAVYHGAFLMELRTSYLYPEQTTFGIQGSITPQEVQEKLELYPDTAAVIITSPTYDGVVSDIAAIAAIVHEKKIPLIVDEAHGAHFGFSAGFPQKASACGADFCIESLHKTLPSYTQTAVLHVAEQEWVDLERVKRYLGIFQTSSPSYIFMAGMDRCTRILEEKGTALFADFEQRLRNFYRESAKWSHVQVFSEEESDAGIWAKDPSKILISAERAACNGQQLYELLLERYHLQMEMASGHYVTALTSIMDTDAGMERLANALQEIDAQAAEAVTKDREILTPLEIYQPGEKACEIYQALDAAKEAVPLRESANRISGEFVYLYPPGIPLAAPGELLTPKLLAVVEDCRERGLQVQGLADLDGVMIRVVK